MNYIILFLVCFLISSLQAMKEESSSNIQMLGDFPIPPTRITDDSSDPFNDINNHYPVSRRNLRQRKQKHSCSRFSQPVLEEHEITYRLPQRIDRSKMPELLPDYYSDGEETNEFHCIRSHCAALTFCCKELIEAHYDQKHNLRSSYKCPNSKCNKKCNSKRHLQTHIDLKHSHKKQPLCPICYAELQTVPAINRHLKDTHRLTPPLPAVLWRQKYPLSFYINKKS